jgi:hypothetical protein
VALLSSVVLVTASALAQDALEEAPGKTDLPDVADRYEGTGYHAGSFWLLPTLETGMFYDSNVRATSSNEEGSLGAYVIPRLELNSDWGRHALNFAVQAEEYLYFDESSQDRTNVFGEMDTRIDIQRDLVFAAGMKGGLFEEQVGDFNTAYYADEPTEYVDFNTWASLNKAFNRLSVWVGVAYDYQNYDDVKSIFGTNIDQDYRDGDVIETGGRISYLISPGYRVFGDFRYNWRDYNDDGGDSDGWRALTGLEFEITRLLRGEVGVGYMEQYYDDGFGDESGFSYHAALIWNPTPLMTVTLDADRSIQDSANAGSPGMIEDNLALRIDYEVMRGWVLTPSAALQRGDYMDGNDGDELTYDLGLKLDHTLNRFISLGAAYVYTYTDYEDPPPLIDNWDRHVIGAYAKARF